MRGTGADVVIRALLEAGIRHVIGIPGTHNIELYDAMLDVPALTPVLVTDEQSASFLADGIARSTGGMACVNVVPGAGLTHALSGIAEAWMDQVPMLVLASGIRRDLDFAFQLHDIDQLAVVRPVCKGTFAPRTHAELARDLAIACALARQAPAGPVAVEVPANLYFFKEEIGPPPAPAVATSVAPLATDAVEAAVRALAGARRIAIYAGAGCAEASAGLVALAERLDALVYTTISGKGVFPEDSPRFVWNLMGAGAPAALRPVEREHEVLLAIACRFGEVATASYGWRPPPTVIHADVDPAVFDRNVKATVRLQGDAAAVIQALLGHQALAPRAPDADRLKALATAKAGIRREQRKPSTCGRVSPGLLLPAVQAVFGPDTIYTCDSGNGLFLAMEHLELPGPRRFLAPVDFSCMGYSVPAAIGARLAQPERPVVALAGDGAFLMTGLELLTAARLGVGVVVILLADGELSQIAQFQRASLQRETCTRLSPPDWGRLAEALGVAPLRLNDDSGIEAVLIEARRLAAAGKAVLVETAIDYEVPTAFSRGVVRTNFLRLPLKDRLRLATRVVTRKVFG